MPLLLGQAVGSILLGQRGHSLQFKLEMDGEVQVNAAVSGLLRNVQNLEPAWTDFQDERGMRVPGVERVLRDSVRDRFSREGSDQFPWPDLADATNLDRIRHGFPPAHPILYRTGLLLDAFTIRSHPYHIFNTARQWMEFGGNIFYAIFHQSPRTRRRLPRRAFLYISKFDVTRILSTLRKFLRAIGMGR